MYKIGRIINIATIAVWTLCLLLEIVVFIPALGFKNGLVFVFGPPIVGLALGWSIGLLVKLYGSKHPR